MLVQFFIFFTLYLEIWNWGEESLFFAHYLFELAAIFFFSFSLLNTFSIMASPIIRKQFKSVIYNVYNYFKELVAYKPDATI